MSRPAFDPTGTVRVLGYEFAVEQRPLSDPLLADEGRKGACNHSRALIAVADSLAPDVKAETVLHEIVHAVEHATDADLSETQVARLARGLYAVCRDNERYMRALLFADAGPSPYANAPGLARAARQRSKP